MVPLHRDRTRVIVADDNPDARAMVALMLEVGGFDVVLAVNGGDALDVLAVHGADVLVSDMNMPVLDGLGLCRALRAVPAWASLPVIVWSSVESDDPRLVEAKELGATFVSKSALVTRLDAAIRLVLPPASAMAEAAMTGGTGA